MNKLYWLFLKTLLIEFSYKLNNLLQLADIFVYTLIFYFVGGLVDKVDLGPLQSYGGEYFPFVLFGLALSWYHSEAQQSFAANLRDEQVLGTLEALLATGTRLPVILAGFSVFDFLRVTLQVAGLFLFGIGFLGVQVFWSNLLPALFILLLSILAFLGFGFISAAFVMVFKRGDPLGWLVSNLSVLLGGVYYPVEVLPLWLQKLAVLLPLTHSLKAIRLVMLKGASLAEVWTEIFVLLLFALLLLPISLLCFRWALKKAVIEGTLAGH